MSDPKNIPLAEARPGDIVHLKPQPVHSLWRDSAWVHLGVGHTIPTMWIDHIERAPKPLKVGGRARHPAYPIPLHIEAVVDGYAAWTMRPGDRMHPLHGWTSVKGLEPVDD